MPTITSLHEIMAEYSDSWPLRLLRQLPLSVDWMGHLSVSFQMPSPIILIQFSRFQGRWEQKRGVSIEKSDGPSALLFSVLPLLLYFWHPLWIQEIRGRHGAAVVPGMPCHDKRRSNWSTITGVRSCWANSGKKGRRMSDSMIVLLFFFKKL